MCIFLFRRKLSHRLLFDPLLFDNKLLGLLFTIELHLWFLLLICFVIWSLDLALLVLFDPVDFIVFSAIWTLSFSLVNLVVVTRVADLVLAIAWIELLFLFFQVKFADVANVVPFHPLLLRGHFFGHLL